MLFYKAGGGRKGHAKIFKMIFKKKKKTSEEEGKFYPFIAQEKYARFMQIIKHLLHNFFFPLRDQNVIASFSNI